MPIATSGFGTLFQSAESGTTSVPDESLIDGDYEGNVVVEGSCELDGNTYVRGDLIVSGTLLCNGSYSLYVGGDLIASRITFDNEGGPVGNITVEGDVVFYNEFLYAQRGEPATLRVGGDLIGKEDIEDGDASFNGSGVNTNGATVYVNGDVVVHVFNVDGADNESGDAYAGGTVEINGNMTINDFFRANGGSSTAGAGGNGGDLQVKGNLNAGLGSISLYGGNGINGNGGNGGELDVEANMVCNELEMYGGDCTSDDGSYYAGSGGNATIDGNFVSNDYVNFSGGSRFGTIEGVVGDDWQGNGGYLSVYGDMVADDVDIHGGYVEVTGAPAQRAGRGGELNVQGNCTVNDDLRLYGGSSNSGHGGIGGYIYIDGSLVCDGDLEFNGGYSDANGEGGYGGECYINGNAYVYALYGYGGTGNNGGGGGNGGSFEVEGTFFTSEDCDLYGGNCNSVDPSHRAGNGGQFRAGSIVMDGIDLEIYGGDRYGATTVAGNPDPANGGQVYINGDAATDDIDAYGGSVFTDAANAAGGQGGYISIEGNLVCDGDLDVTGGRGTGNNGGNGGSIYVEGTCVANYIYASGGYAENSGAGGDAGVNGGPGQLSFNGGVTTYEISMLDGNGVGSTPSNFFELNLRGSCHINTLNVSTRTDGYVRSGNTPTTLKVNSMPNRNFLNNGSGNVTVDLSAMIEDSIFITNANSDWFRIAGTGVMD